MPAKQYHNPPKPKLFTHKLRWTDTKKQEFLVQDIVPAGALTCISAPPGAGKTTLACMLAATVPPPRDPDDPTILFIAPLADCALDLRPRFNQLHLNPARVLVYEKAFLEECVETYPYRPVTIADLDEIRDEIADKRTYRLIIIDNAELFFDLPGRPSRTTILKHLYRLHDIAYERGISILLLLTIPKYNSNPLTSTFLSCIEEVCRSSWILAPDKENPEQRLLLHHKTTCHADIANTRYATIAATRKVATLPADLSDPWGEPCPYPNDPHGLPTPPPDPNAPIPLSEDVAAIRVLSLLPPEPDALTYRDYLAYRPPPRRPGPLPTKLQFACEVLSDILAEGPMRSLEVLNQMAAAGIRQPTALEAKSRLNIQSDKIAGRWYWLPNPDPCAHSPETTPSSTKTAENEAIPAQTSSQHALSPEGGDQPIAQGKGALSPEGGDQRIAQGKGTLSPEGGDQRIAQGKGALSPEGGDQPIAQGKGTPAALGGQVYYQEPCKGDTLLTCAHPHETTSSSTKTDLLRVTPCDSVVENPQSEIENRKPEMERT